MKYAFRLSALVLIAVALIGYNMTIQARNDNALKAKFMELDKMDYKLQNVVRNVDNLEQLASEIYCEPYLDEAVKYLKTLKENDICFEIESLVYEDIEVSQYAAEEAVMEVKTSLKGRFYPTSDPEDSLQQVDKTACYEVVMKMRKEGWKIADIEQLN